MTAGQRDPGEALARVHARLTAAVEELAGSVAWRRMLTVAARFPVYSANNVLLIAAQRPEATRVAGFGAWRSLGRHVRRGERGIAILAPVTRRPTDPASLTGGDRAGDAEASGAASGRRLVGFRVAHVFDVSQTDGEPLPVVTPPALLAGDAPVGLDDALVAAVRAAGFDLTEGRCAPANGVTDFTARRVTLQLGLPAAQRVKTLTHELAHVRMHDPAVTGVPLARGRCEVEVEAESVAFVVLAAHGMDAAAYSVPYVSGWAEGRPELLATTARRVLAAARDVLDAAPPPAGFEPPPSLAGPPPRLPGDTGRGPELGRQLPELAAVRGWSR